MFDIYYILCYHKYLPNFIGGGFLVMRNIMLNSEFGNTCDEYKDIRLKSETGDVDVVVKQFKELLRDMPGLVFKFAEIRQKKLPGFPTDSRDEDFYPLRLYASNNLRIMISEVRCGYHGASTYAMIECLKLAGFTPKKPIIETIYNESSNVKITLYNEDVANRY